MRKLSFCAKSLLKPTKKKKPSLNSTSYLHEGEFIALSKNLVGTRGVALPFIKLEAISLSLIKWHLKVKHKEILIKLVARRTLRSRLSFDLSLIHCRDLGTPVQLAWGESAACQEVKGVFPSWWGDTRRLEVFLPSMTLRTKRLLTISSAADGIVSSSVSRRCHLPSVGGPRRPFEDAFLWALRGGDWLERSAIFKAGIRCAKWGASSGLARERKLFIAGVVTLDVDPRPKQTEGNNLNWRF